MGTMNTIRIHFLLPSYINALSSADSEFLATASALHTVVTLVVSLHTKKKGTLGQVPATVPAKCFFNFKPTFEYSHPAL